MKKIIYVLIAIFISVTVVVCMYISSNNRYLRSIQEVNNEYEIYLDKTVLGTDVTTIINKAINSNEKNSIQKNSEGMYIENDTNSIKVEIIFLSEEGQKTYQMETLQKVGIQGFIKNFNLIDFKCSKIEYHEKTKYVSKIIFEQLEK